MIRTCAHLAASGVANAFPRSRGRLTHFALMAMIHAPSALAQGLADTAAYSGWAIAFYTLATTIVAAFFLINIALKNTIGLCYSALFAVFLLWVWIMEGGLIGLGVTEETSLRASVSVSLLACGTGYLTAAISFDPEVRARIWKTTLTVLGGASLTLIPFAWAGEVWRPSALILALLGGMVAGHVRATATWKTHHKRAKIMPIVTTIIWLATVGLLAVLFATGGIDVWVSDYGLLRLIFAAIAFPTMAAVILELNDMRIARDAALNDAVIAARRDAEMSASLLEMEKLYTRAKRVADDRTRQLTTASHDIRQPIASLRAELDALVRSIPAETAERLSDVLDHLDALTGTLSRGQGEGRSSGLQDDVRAETLPVALLFQTLARLFSNEANAAGINLRFARSEINVHAPPLIVIRIVGNLIANAIQHSSASAILVGLRRSGARVRLDVIDNGRGFPEGQINWALKSGAMGPGSKGTGQGLSIARDLSQAYGLDLEGNTGPDRGTRLSIYLQRVPQTA